MCAMMQKLRVNSIDMPKTFGGTMRARPCVVNRGARASSMLLRGSLPRQSIHSASYTGCCRTTCKMRVLGPDATLQRGYSITTGERGKIIRTIAVVRPKIKIRTRVSDGEFGSETL